MTIFEIYATGSGGRRLVLPGYFVYGEDRKPRLGTCKPIGAILILTCALGKLRDALS